MTKYNLDYEEVIIKLSRLKKLGKSIKELMIRILELGRIDREAVELIEEHTQES